MISQYYDNDLRGSSRSAGPHSLSASSSHESGKLARFRLAAAAGGTQAAAAARQPECSDSLNISPARACTVTARRHRAVPGVTSSRRASPWQLGPRFRPLWRSKLDSS